MRKLTQTDQLVIPGFDCDDNEIFSFLSKVYMDVDPSEWLVEPCSAQGGARTFHVQHLTSGIDVALSLKEEKFAKRQRA